MRVFPDFLKLFLSVCLEAATSSPRKQNKKTKNKNNGFYLEFLKSGKFFQDPFYHIISISMFT